MYFICIYAWIIKKKSEKDLKINNGWFSRWSCQALQQAISLSCLDRKEGEDENKPFFFFLKKRKKLAMPPLPTPNKFYFEKLDKKALFFFFFLKSSEELTVPLFVTSLNLKADTHCSSHLGTICWQRQVLVLVFMGSQSALEHSWSVLIREISPILSHSSQVDQVTCRYGTWPLVQRWHPKSHEPQEYVSRCPGDVVRGFPLLHSACTHLQGMERGFFYIGNRTSQVRKAGGQQHWSPVLGGWVSGGEGIRSLEYMSVFIGSHRKIQTAFLLTTGE